MCISKQWATFGPSLSVATLWGITTTAEGPTPLSPSLMKGNSEKKLLNLSRRKTLSEVVAGELAPSTVRRTWWTMASKVRPDYHAGSACFASLHLEPAASVSCATFTADQHVAFLRGAGPRVNAV